MDVHATFGHTKRPLTPRLVAELIGDGNVSDLDESDLENQLQTQEDLSTETSSDEGVSENDQEHEQPSCSSAPPATSSSRGRSTQRQRNLPAHGRVQTRGRSRKHRYRSVSHQSSNVVRSRSRRSHSAEIAGSSRARIWRRMQFSDKDHSYPSWPAVSPRPEMDYFSQYFNDDFFENCAECTNLYYMRNTGKVLNTTAHEIKKFFGVLLVMGCISYPRIHMYWRQNMDLKLISSVMTRDRFFILRNNIHVVPTDTAPESNPNPLWKIQPAVDAVKKACLRLERVPGYYSIDEQMIPFTGRCRIKVLVRNKPRPVGLKNFVVTTSEGLMVNFEIYFPQNPVFDRSLGEGPGVILYLAESIPPGSCVYFDRYFNTIPLLDKLNEMGLHGTGTIMANRVPNGKNLKLGEKKGMKRGDVDQFVSGEVALVKWMDNNVVLMASNCTGADTIKYVPKWDKKRKEYVPVKAPQTVLNYNTHMGGVDVLDQTIEYYRTFQKTKKWTVKVLIHLLDLAVANAWRQFKMERQNQTDPELKKDATKDLLWFRLDIADALMHCPEQRRVEGCSDEEDHIQLPGKYRPPPPPSARAERDIKKITFCNY